MEDVSAITRLFLWLGVLKSRESGGCLSYCHTSSVALGIQVKRKWRTSQLVPYFFSSHEKVEGVSAIIIVFLLLWTLKWEKVEHVSANSYFFYYFGHSSREKVEHVSTMFIPFLLRWTLKSRESQNVWAIIILFPLLWTLKSRESGACLTYYHTFSVTLNIPVKRKWRTSQLLSYLLRRFARVVRGAWMFVIY